VCVCVEKQATVCINIYYVFNCNGQRHWQNEGGIRGVCVISDAQPAHKSHNCGCLRPFWIVINLYCTPQVVKSWIYFVSKVNNVLKSIRDPANQRPLHLSILSGWPGPNVMHVSNTRITLCVFLIYNKW